MSTKPLATAEDGAARAEALPNENKQWSSFNSIHYFIWSMNSFALPQFKSNGLCWRGDKTERNDESATYPWFPLVRNAFFVSRARAIRTDGLLVETFAFHLCGINNGKVGLSVPGSTRTSYNRRILSFFFWAHFFQLRLSVLIYTPIICLITA